MAKSVEQFLAQRGRQVEAVWRPAGLLASVAFHGAVIAAVWLVPELFAKPPDVVYEVSVVVVPPQVLGTQEPPPPPPPKPPPPEPEPPPPEPPPPEPEPVPEDVPILPEEKKVEKPPPPPPPRPAPPPPPKVEPPPKRIGSAFGDPLGATANETTLGVEDPNFTYGYYLDRVVAAISANWQRPMLGNLETKLHFRILRDGAITRLKVVTPSGSSDYDAAALRAVEASSPLPPLPKGYGEDDLGIYLIVR